MENTITIKNELPELLDAVWHHADCPDWLHDLIWEGINERIAGGTKMSPAYWKSQLESCRPDGDGPTEVKLSYGYQNVTEELSDREN